MPSRTRLWALIRKELRQILRNRGLLVSLIIPPTVQIIIFGLALNPTVNHLRLAVLDESRSSMSRDLISAFIENRTFVLAGQVDSVAAVDAGLRRGSYDAALVIPFDLDRRIARRQDARVQLLIDATNANTAAMAQGYAGLIVREWNAAHAPPGSVSVALPVRTRVALLYNPGLITAWFIVSGTFGLILVLNGSIVSAQTTIRERDSGTLEQLLMTPAETSEIVVAKIVPLFMLLMCDVFLILVVTRLVFSVPVRGSLALIVCGGALCLVAGIGVGTCIASFSKSALQAQLLSFFVNPPLALLAGATTPVEAMPPWLRPVTWLNPIRHFSIIARGILIKGTGLPELWPYFVSLGAIAGVLLIISIYRFRSQLA